LFNLLIIAYSELNENRIAVAKLANLVSSNNSHIYFDLVQLGFYLNIFSKELELIYEEGNIFFMTFEESVSKWEKLETMNQYSPGLFELMRNKSDNFSTILFKAESSINAINKFAPSVKSDLAKHNEGKEIILFQWIDYLNIGLWCDTSIIKKCEYELSRIRKIVEFLKNVSFNQIGSSLYVYSDYMSNIIENLSRKNVKVTVKAPITNNLRSLINRIKSSHMKFLMKQDVALKLSSSNDNISNITENVRSVYKSKLIGEVGCQEFETYFASPPIFQGSRMTDPSSFLRSIKIDVGALLIGSLTFEWSNNISIKYGGNGYLLRSLNLEKGEIVSWVNIYKCERGNICGLEFRTNKWQTTGVLGNSINPTILEAPRGYEIVGLYGGYDKFICGIGILYSKIEIK
jgi:hypothetical protein